MASVTGKKYRVNAAARDGFVDRRRAGEAWPRGMGRFREVLVLDQDEDPPGRLHEGEFAIGQKTFQVLKEDPEIFTDIVSVTGGADADAEKAALQAKVTAHETRIAELEALLAQATDPGKVTGGADAGKGKGEDKGSKGK